MALLFHDAARLIMSIIDDLKYLFERTGLSADINLR